MTSGVHALDGAADFARKQVGNNIIRCFALGQILGAGTGRVEVLVADFESHRFPSNVPTTGVGGVRSSRSSNPMHPPEEFLRHATECKVTAKLARDPASKAAWSQMAERWLQCAELAERKSSTARYATPAGRSRSPSPAWR